jgi:hypothetical protein
VAAVWDGAVLGTLDQPSKPSGPLNVLYLWPLFSLFGNRSVCSTWSTHMRLSPCNDFLVA